MKRCMLTSIVSLLFSLLLPVSVPYAAGVSGVGTLPGVSDTASAAPPETPAPVLAGFDALTGIKLLRGGAVETLSMAEYLPGVVAGEMPASFEPDALRAQARALRLPRAFHGRAAGGADDPGGSAQPPVRTRAGIHHRAGAVARMGGVV